MISSAARLLRRADVYASVHGDVVASLGILELARDDVVPDIGETCAPVVVEHLVAELSRREAQVRHEIAEL